uniref:Uridylate-specific endoribonuclease n=1 Tax=Dicentrarchus labrax TaxID=13489 RepID=A0A8C4IG25_DICLA
MSMCCTGSVESLSSLLCLSVDWMHQGTVTSGSIHQESLCLPVFVSFLCLYPLTLCHRPAVNQELSNIFNELWRLDVNRMTPGVDYTISVQVRCIFLFRQLLSSVFWFLQRYILCLNCVQGRASYVNQGSHVVQDHASQPLFSNVNENKLKNTTTFSRFTKLLDNYERSTGVAERVTTEELTEINLFLDAVLETEVMKRAHKYLVSKGQSSSNLRHFKSQLQTIWFNLYHRQRNAGLDSCGFEHVFVGETKSGTEIIGFHNWVQFYLQENSTHLDYKGYKARNHDLVSVTFHQITDVTTVVFNIHPQSVSDIPSTARSGRPRSEPPVQLARFGEARRQRLHRDQP